MQIPILDLSKYTTREQMNKICEEINELYEADNTNDAISECFDLIQSSFGLLDMLLTKNDDIAAKEHTLKLLSRERNGGLKVIGWRSIVSDYER